MKKIGLDLGSSSLGWAIRNNDEISKKGVITFSSGMVKGQGGYSSPTRDRREARSKRNLIRARKYRKWELLKTLCRDREFVPLDTSELETWSSYKKGKLRKFPENDFFLSWLACDFSYEGGEKYKNPYELRVKALDERLSKHEFGRVLYHIVQRRGYKDIGESDKETETQIKRRGESGFQEALDNNRTIAEALTKEFLNKGKRARNEYPYREEYQNELELICQSQGYDISKEGKYGYHDQFVLSLWKAIIWQRPLRTQKGTIGKCTLETSKLRCPVSHPIYEISRAWQFINTIKFYNETEEKQFLSKELRYNLFNELFIRKDSFKFEDIRKFLDKKLKRKSEYNYPISQKTGKYESNVSGMPFCNGIIKILEEPALQSLSEIEEYDIGNAPKIINGYSILDIWHAVFDFDEEYLDAFANEKLGIANVTVKRNKKEVSLSPLVILKKRLAIGYGDLSIKALKKIIPFLKQGYLYNEAVVFAKLPELLGKTWEEKKNFVLGLAKKSNETYNWSKMIIRITNNLIDNYKGEVEEWRDEGTPVRAWKDFKYLLNEQDANDIKIACNGYFGEESWKKREDKEKIESEVGKEYQEFFFDTKRAYREVPTLTCLFKESLQESGIVLNGELYHHSKRKNIYGTTVKDRKTGREILPIPIIDSIKNPMFNKSMSILRRLMNELILKGEIDKDTEVVIEVARELNDNNKRAAIERYQNERQAKRGKIKAFLEEFKDKENKSFNVEERIRDFELWSEQIFEKSNDTTGQKAKEILREKNAVKLYELWMEQKGQCLYTGKMISVSQLFSNEIDIEHTIPRSLLPDNTMANLTVCYAKYNREDKGKLIPYYCKNYSEDIEGVGSAIKPRLFTWGKTRDNYKALYESRLKPRGNEDEAKKNKRIQEKHYFKIHYDYWKDKVERFTTKEVKDSWARRQLVDTQMVSKYAREFLRTYFKKVAVQKGSVTADFRKIYGFQETDEIKSRNKHTHHAIDAAVLALIPVNSSRRDALLKKMYKMYERERKQFIAKPYGLFSSQELIEHIENQTLIVNYEKDKILQQTVKNIRKRGKLQYITDKQGSFIKDESGNRIIKKTQGDTLRSNLYAQTYLGKIKDVEHYSDGQPIRENNDWKYKSGKDEFIFVKREKIEKVKASDKLISVIIDPIIKNLVKEQKNSSEIKDYQGNIIRHVRVKTSTGKEVKERLNYRSEHSYKNKYYSEAGSIPYAIILQKSFENSVVREMIPVASFEIAKVYKLYRKFTPELYIETFHPELKEYQDIELLKVGQKVLVLNNDEEFEKRKTLEFQQKRLYVISQFSDGSIWLKYHLNAQSKDEVKKSISIKKDELLREYERELGIVEVVEDLTIQDNKKRIDDYNNRRYRFDTISKSFRLKRICDKVGTEKAKEIKKELDKYKAIPSRIEIEGETQLLKMSKENWNFLFEGNDFKVNFLGEISNWKN